jgi:ammonia channel protein AmtB
LLLNRSLLTCVCTGLAASLVVGKRKAFGQGQELPPHNILLVFMGASLLWVGRCGWVWVGDSEFRPIIQTKVVP